MTVLVIGATGNVGGAALRALQARGVPVRAFARRPIEGVDVALGDLDDPATVRRALDGVDRVLLSTGDGPGKLRQETDAIDACAAAGVRLIVKASTLRAERGSALPPFDWHGRAEEHLARSGVPAVVLRSAFYTTNLQPRDGILAAPAGDGAIAMIDPRDVGEAAAAVLAGGGREGRVYALTGAEAITYAQAAEALGCDYADLPPEALAGAGLPDWLARHLDGIFALARAGALAETTGDLRELIGREPRALDGRRQKTAPVPRGG